MKKLFLIISVITISCLKKKSEYDEIIFINKTNQDTLVFLNDDYRMTIYSKDEIIYDFELHNLKTSVLLHGAPELILIDDEIPEGSLREDHNNPNDYIGYECEGTYQYIIENIKISFALEKAIKKRLDLVIYDSNCKDFINGDYTLIRQL